MAEKTTTDAYAELAAAYARLAAAYAELLARFAPPVTVPPHTHPATPYWPTWTQPYVTWTGGMGSISGDAQAVVMNLTGAE